MNWWRRSAKKVIKSYCPSWSEWKYSLENRKPFRQKLREIDSQITRPSIWKHRSVTPTNPPPTKCAHSCTQSFHRFHCSINSHKNNSICSQRHEMQPTGTKPSRLRLTTEKKTPKRSFLFLVRRRLMEGSMWIYDWSVLTRHRESLKITAEKCRCHNFFFDMFQPQVASMISINVTSTLLRRFRLRRNCIK